MTRIVASIVFSCLMLAALTGRPTFCQGGVKKPERFPLWQFDASAGTCRAKGRLQDKEYCQSRLMDEIVAQGKSAVPILIAQLTDSHRIKQPIFDYWTRMTAGDIAYFILNNLFTDPDWTTFNMPGLDSFRGNCAGTAEGCWRDYLRKHGRKYVQAQWRTAWVANQDRIRWDPQARCFQLGSGGGKYGRPDAPVSN